MATYQLVSAGRRPAKNGDLLLALAVRDSEHASEARLEVVVRVLGSTEDADPDRLLAAAVLERLREIRAALAGGGQVGLSIAVPASQIVAVAREPGLPSIAPGTVVATIES